MSTKRALRIAHIDTERTWRGGQQQVFSLIRGLSALGHSNLAVVRKGFPLAHRLEDQGESIFRVSPWGEWDIFAASLVRAKLRQERIDVVHAHSSHGAALAALSVRGTTIPFVVTRRVDFHLARNPFSRWKYNRAARLIAISEGVRRILLDDGISAERVDLVYSGVDFSRFNGVRPISRDALGVPSGCHLVGQVAALVPHKDQATFLAALQILRNAIPNVRAVIVGEGKLEQDLKSQAQSLGLESSVHFLGYRSDTLAIIAACDAFCLSSQEEGLGTSILDAMALGIPVAATRAGGIPEMIEDQKTGFLAEVRDPKGLAEAMKSALVAPNRHAIAAAARLKVRDFDVAHTVSRTLAVYEAVLKIGKRA